MLKHASTWFINRGLILILGVLLVSSCGKDVPSQNQTMNAHPRFEAKQKQTLVDQDVALTNELCRRQCNADLRRIVKQLKDKEKDGAIKQINAMRQEHPHMISLQWKDSKGMDIKSSSLSEQLQSSLADALKKAEISLDQGQSYEQSSTVDDDHYLVLAVPNENGGGILSVVNQSILKQVTNHQKNNLHLVPYPPEGNYKIESVDSNTKQDIHVDEGEENGGASHYHKYQIVVKFKTPPTTELLDNIKQDVQATTIRQLGYTYMIESKQKTAEQMLDYFNHRKDVQYAEPHYLYMTNEISSEISSEVPNDYLFEMYQWNLPSTQTLEGWEISKGSDEIVIGILDTGVDLDHPDLVGRLTEGINIIDPNVQPMDDVGHGTHVAGVISALVNNEEGIAGMTWYDKVMPVKVLDNEGAGSTYSVAQGLIWAVDNGVKVINMSLGNYAEAEFLHDAIRYAYDQDVVLIAATGNDNTSDPGYPAAYPEVLAVSAVDELSQRAPFSNYGDYVDVVAPGVSIASTYPHNQYAALSGTSMASPHVSALAALIRSVNPSLRNTEVMDIMRNTAIDLGEQGKDPFFGYGQIDVAAALAAAKQSKVTGLEQEKQMQIETDRNANNQSRVAQPVQSDLLQYFSDWFKRELERIHAKQING